MTPTSETIFDPITREVRLPNGVALPHASEWAYSPYSGRALPKSCHIAGSFFVRKSFDEKSWIVVNGEGWLVQPYYQRDNTCKTRSEAIEACNEMARLAAWNVGGAS